MAAALGQLGRVDEARFALDQAIAVSAGSFALRIGRRLPWFCETDHQHMLDGLRKAGWNDGGPR
jgi:adenylate cyclase